MDPLPQADRCSCEPRVVRAGKEYPPKMGEGRSGPGPDEREDGEGDGDREEGKKKKGEGVGLVETSPNPGVESAVQGLK